MPVFGLIDGNSFYCSCERAFKPSIQKKPVVVLSNNDGCSIARTAEAKALGVKMGEPYHVCKERPELSDVVWFSSNYVLYGDLSRRFYLSLAERLPKVEPYSIDEMFIDLSGFDDVAGLCAFIRSEVMRVAKIPTCIGWGPTKTLAKLANAIAKKHTELNGLCDLTNEQTRKNWLDRLDIDEVWGLGKQNCAKLHKLGVRTIADFVALPPEHVQKLLSVVGKRLQLELKGQSCLSFADMETNKKSIATTKSFGRVVTQWKEMREVIATYATRAAEKLRAEGLQAGYLSVFIHTNRHSGDPYYSNQRGAVIEPTYDTAVLITESIRLLKPLWKNGYRYYKAGIILNDLSCLSNQSDLFSTYDKEKSGTLMQVLDDINARYGRGTLRPSSTALRPSWGARSAMRSPRYTTHLDEIVKARSW
ncbi:Y-family DNA polymerase [Aristophania vespae]|uniref:Y-family DNA polymerase n=1 Tax=Aristophania vespae TaxID=2697033 RepID=UPI0023513CA5|nr:Y-family DNA polymerase [Aristophania vespae]UMM63135.1 Protein UmuC [Aristophania vespae]